MEPEFLVPDPVQTIPRNDSSYLFTNNSPYGNYPVQKTKEYENAETELKKQEARLKEAETKLKFQEVEYKDAEVNLKKKDAQLKSRDIEMKKLEIEMKKLELARYKHETNHLDRISKIKEDHEKLKNLDKRFEMVNKIGLTFGNRTDFEIILKMTELLGDENIMQFKDDLKAIENRIRKKMGIKETVYG